MCESKWLEAVGVKSSNIKLQMDTTQDGDYKLESGFSCAVKSAYK